MATTRGFVERIEIGRGGLVTVTIVEADASRSLFVISDIDGDPERFNERLSELAVLRDAMNRAEPVEIEHDEGEAGEEITRAARISRDALDPPTSLDPVSGLVLQVVVTSQNALSGDGEAHDLAQVSVLGVDGSVHLLRLDLQAPERLVATSQLDVVRAAQAQGEMCSFVVSGGDDGGGSQDIVSVGVGAGANGDVSKGQVVSAFVESLGLVPTPGAGAGLAAFAVTRATSAPEFNGPGGTVDPAAFSPQLLDLYVAPGSLTYSLVEAGLRDNVRMRLSFVPLVTGGKPDGPNQPKDHGPNVAVAGGKGEGSDEATAALLVAAELLAPLASASRPVWVRIDRAMLDRGPEAECMPGLPSSDLKVQTLRDLRIPYPAIWCGHGCFNHGVYRFQLTAPAGSTLQVDECAICLYETGTAGVTAGYACIEGDHVVTVEIPAYTCDTEFDLDVYRIR